ncbi:MAG TPA: dephospho-CoA kinase [Candidatus Sumerlaeota bacterium]|nr:dephospho-CoA kinase [Candidatus Sumerlaeota bacterium]
MLIGLTGTFGSGKSSVAAMFEELGAAVVDADAIAHEVVEPGQPALEAIRREFGAEYLTEDGALDRGRMAATVFADPVRREALNRIIHPRVIERMRSEIARFEAQRRQSGQPEVVVLNVPLLLEVALAGLAERVVVVTIREAERFRRVRHRDGLSEREVVARLASQWPQRRKVAAADDVIDNSGTLEATRNQVVDLYREWTRQRGNGPDGSG